jgi:pyruvate kinase
MIARGDLGIETPLWELPVRQKEIVEQVRKKMKPVIVATQMLDSMIRNPLPTRAEVSDVANAVYDSADAVMLSGESASGKHPVEAVEMMRKVLEVTEKDQIELPDMCGDGALEIVQSVARSAKYIAMQIGARAIFAGTASGASARAVSFFRPQPQIIAITQDERVARELAIVWGVSPVAIKGKKLKTVESLLDYAVAILKCDNSLCKEEKIIWISGDRVGVTGKTNTLSIRSVL